eukprot:4474753-Pleurochrysis_carterae.AAC.2
MRTHASRRALYHAAQECVVVFRRCALSAELSRWAPCRGAPCARLVRPAAPHAVACRFACSSRASFGQVADDPAVSLPVSQPTRPILPLFASVSVKTCTG